MRESTRVLVALVTALALGIAIAATGNATLVKSAGLIAPLGTVWVNAIRMTIIPLVVSLLITGVASAADVSTIGRLGKRTLLVFVFLLGGTAALVVPIGAAVFALVPQGGAVRPPLPAGSAEAAAQITSIDQGDSLTSWFTSLIPANPVAAAAYGQMVPLILFTLLLALAIARTPPAARQTLVGFFEAMSAAMLVLVRWVILVAPLGIFALILPLAVQSGAAAAGAIGFYILAYSIASIAVTLLVYPVVALAGGTPVRVFARAVIPAQLIAFSSSSSIASLPALVEGAERGLGLPSRVSGFVLPLAVSAFKLAAPVSWTVGALFVGWFYGVPLHARELAIVAFAAVFLAFASPGVPRGAFIMLAPLFIAIGLPPEGIGILIAVDAIPDMFATVLNVTGDLAAVALVAKPESKS